MTLTAHTARSTRWLQPSGPILATASADKTIRVDRNTSAAILTLAGHTSEVKTIASAPTALFDLRLA